MAWKGRFGLRDVTWRLLLRAALALGIAAAAGAAGPSLAGPPYLSDDPEPTDVGHWEIYTFATGLGGPDGMAGEAGFDINYGAAKDWQLTAVLPLALGAPNAFSETGLRAGPGDVELAVKYKFLHQSDGTWTPDVAVFPRLFAPTANHALGSGRFGLLLPIWAEKDFGPWSVFGGGGYQFNPGPDQRNFWQGGGAISRSFGERLSLGAELFGQTRDTYAGGAYTTLNVAATYRLTHHWSVLTSAGPAWDRARAEGYVFYGALKADY
jgi:hypothetical protein